MSIKLNRTESIFRNELIFATDAKAVKIDNVILNLCLLLRFNGKRPTPRARRGGRAFVDMDMLHSVLDSLEIDGHIEGFKDNREAAIMWLRTNLVNLVNRGKVEKENIASLRPIHLESYKVRNAKHARDYNSSDQIYQMLGADPAVREALKAYLNEGWDSSMSEIQNSSKMDVDSLGILHFVKEIEINYNTPENSRTRVSPILLDQAKLFCRDIHKLLVYKDKIPRSVIIDYLKTITAFHLSLYTRKLIYLLPQMVKEGTKDVLDDWNMVVDVTDDLVSGISGIAIRDAEKVYNALFSYIRSTFQINSVINEYGLKDNDSNSLKEALDILKNPPSNFEANFQARWNLLRNSHEDEDKLALDELTAYEDGAFNRYIQILMEVRGNYQYRFHTQFIDHISLKNDEKGCLVQGRSKKHPRRFTFGTKLLETLVQLMVLDFDTANNKYSTADLTVEDLIQKIYDKYGLIINGLSHPRFANADLSTTQAFRENVDAFKSKLRKIGFYNDLSDAYILQKIEPRYDIE